MDLKRAVNGDQVTVGASRNPTLDDSFKKSTRSALLALPITFPFHLFVISMGFSFTRMVFPNISNMKEHNKALTTTSFC